MQASERTDAMCDDLTQEDDDAALGVRGLSRRAFAALGVATAAFGAASAIGGGAQAASPVSPSRHPITERRVRVDTPDGHADAFFVHPAQGAFPGIVLWPDIAGLRDVFMMMARRLAGEGYAVLAVNQYYRSAPSPVLGSFAEWRTPEGQAKLKPMIAAITPAGTMSDARTFVAFLDEQLAVDKARRIGTCGYCMGGPFAVRTAAAVIDRVGVAASLHGANLVGPEPDSPVNLIERTHASFVFAIARNDDARSPGDKDALGEKTASTRHAAFINVYPADHGWTVADAPAYDKDQAEAVWTVMSQEFARL
jgi:carboxymethylenebutenolidase